MARVYVFALVCAAACAFAGAASAQAPIVYAGRSGAPAPVAQTASLSAALAGGDEGSYGYGAQQRPAGAVIDIRRPAVPRTVQAAEPHITEAAPPSEQSASRPQWLEQERVGPPYEANGRWYVPTPEPGYSETGTASWYGPQFHGQRAANGDVYDQEALTAAHPTLPLNSLVQVTNLENGREAIVRVTDRGPYVGERLIDVSRQAADVLGFEAQGRARVHVRYLGPAPRRVTAEGAAASVQAPERAGEGPISIMPPPAPLPAPEPAMAIVAVAYPSPAPAVGAASGYFVQVGAFSDLSNAHRVRDQVGTAGPVVVDIRQTAAGAELFRVRLGPWSSRAEADAARQTLAALGYGEAVIAAR
jgi:rare lipoprotein A